MCKRDKDAVKDVEAAEDDIEAVKQLCQMGFSRGQAVTALEKYGYDVQRALNSLLGKFGLCHLRKDFFVLTGMGVGGA